MLRQSHSQDLKKESDASKGTLRTIERAENIIYKKRIFAALFLPRTNEFSML
jgi:hypothetical protein